MTPFLKPQEPPIPMLRRQPPKYRAVVWLIWTYFWLLIFEGALRKWVFPGLSDVLLVVRDPFALLIIAKAWQEGIKIPEGVTLFFFVAIPLFAMFGLIHVAGDMVTPKVFLFGMRTYFLHTPLLFVMAKALTADDVSSFVRWILWISIPMSALMGVQFLSPPEAWVNKGVGLEGSQIAAARDHIRAAGTFSFISGPIAFYSLVMACALSQFFGGRKNAWNLAHLALAASILVGATAGSRGLIVSYALVAAALVICICLRPDSFTGGIKVAIVASIAVAVLGFTSIFKEGVAVLAERTISAGDAEGGAAGFGMRIFASFTDPLWAGASVPFYGAGIGLGTNVGSMLATGEVAFLMAEGEWGRVFCEVGIVGGVLFIGFRTWLTVSIALRGVVCAGRGHVLPFLLLSAAAPQLWNGQWGVATSLGFAIFTGGLALAATGALRAEQPRSGAHRGPAPQRNAVVKRMPLPIPEKL